MKKTVKSLVVFLIFVCGQTSCLNKEVNSARPALYNDDFLPNLPESTDPENTGFEMTAAEQVMKSLAVAYPRQIDRVEFRGGDWAVLLRGMWYFYAEGRLLPEDKLDLKENYSRHRFYYYPEELPPWQRPSPEQIEHYRMWENNRRENTIHRAPYFYDNLWRIHSHAEAERRVQRFHFLGFNVRAHYMILENLSRVEQAVREAARTNHQIETWISNIRTIEHFSWRYISASENRSHHSYGLAFDILPQSYGGRDVYWMWTMQSGVDWWTVPYNRRWSPPDAVIKIFERYGFVWGGKWIQFDTVHFEYRPEILIFNSMPPETRR